MSEEQKKLKALLVDDDNFLLELYALKFSKNGYDVVTANGGEDAIAKLEEGLVPDVMVLDIIMPKMDGLDLLRAIRDKNLIQGVPRIVLSNQGAPSDIRAAQELGANGYIVKATTIPSEVVAEVGKIYQATVAAQAANK